ncbi:MAG: AsmA family protein [Deltaproteobacteria bacterium]|nr:AsmA family protein [Deltaproteobacteria bacterium]
MKKRKYHVWIWLFSFFGLLVIAAGVFLYNLDWNKAKPYISAAASKATGRQLVINGDLNVNLGWISKLRARQIQFQNASWSSHPQMVEVELLDVDLDVWQLLKFRIVLPAITISNAKVILEKNAEGSANWEFSEAPAETKPAAPKDRTTFPVIEKLIIKDSALLFTNQETDARIDLKLNHAEAGGFWETPVKLKAEGRYQQQPLSLSLGGGSYQNLTSAKEPYPVQINLRAGDVRAKVEGNLIEPLQMKGENVTLDIQGQDMSNLFPLIRLVFPSTPPYRLKGHLKHEGDVWAFSNFSGQVGGSDLSGTIRVDTAPKRHVMKADLVSSMLDFKDLAGFIGGDPKAQKKPEEPKKAAAEPESDRIFPDQRYDLERLNAMDADVRLRAKKILAPNLPIDNLDARLDLKNGVLRFEPASFGVANGRIEIHSTFDASKRPSNVKIDVRARNLELRRFMGESSFAQKTLAPIGGRIAVSGTGESFRELMATASGNIFFAMSGGEISGLLVELAGLDVAQTLGLLIRGDNPIPIRCALVDLEGENGQMDVKTFVFDTASTIVVADGKIDLRDEKVNIVLTPVPKNFSPLSLRSYIRTTGRFKSISVFPDPLRTGTESLFAKIFNVFVMIALMPVQPRDLGLGRDADCDGLIAAAQKKDPVGVVPTAGQNTVPANQASAQRHARATR